MPPTTKKKFDCVEFKRHVQTEIYERIKRLDANQQIEFLRRRAETGPLGSWWKTLKEHNDAESSR